MLASVSITPYTKFDCDGSFTISPATSAPGSIEGYVYTNLPMSFHLIYLPEVVLQTLAFAGLLVVWEKRPIKKLTIPLVVIFFLVLLINSVPVLQTILGGS